jgi:7-carboxy-7-deazaguanine synthase
MSFDRENSLLVNCIYLAPEGEGVRIGTPQIFLRLQGCAIGCVNCDTKETWDFDEKYAQNLEDVIKKIDSYPYKNVSITGGDPLDTRHRKNLLKLIKKLKDKNYYINIEASGAKVDEEIFDLVDFISFDFKTPSTEVKLPLKNLHILAANYSHKSQLKSVIAHQKDFSAVYQLYSDHPDLRKLQWVLTPCYEPGASFPTVLIKNIIQWTEEVAAPFRIILQQHKVVYGPNERQV